MISASGREGGAGGVSSLPMRVTWCSGGGAMGPCGASCAKSGEPSAANATKRIVASSVHNGRERNRIRLKWFISNSMQGRAFRAARLATKQLSLAQAGLVRLLGPFAAAVPQKELASATIFVARERNKS